MWAKFVRSNFFHILNIYRFHYKQRNVIKQVKQLFVNTFKRNQVNFGTLCCGNALWKYYALRKKNGKSVKFGNKFS